MAKTFYAVEYLGAISAKQSQMYNSADVLALYPTANVMKLKTEGVRVSVNNSDMFPIDFNDENYLVAGHTYIFDKDCVITIGRYQTIA